MTNITIVDNYVATLVRGARSEMLPDGTVCLTSLQFPEVPGFGATQEEAAGDLYGLLEETVRVALRRNLPLPVLDGIDLNADRSRLLASYHPPARPGRHVYTTDDEFLDALA